MWPRAGRAKSLRRCHRRRRKTQAVRLTTTSTATATPPPQPPPQTKPSIETLRRRGGNHSLAHTDDVLPRRLTAVLRYGETAVFARVQRCQSATSREGESITRVHKHTTRAFLCATATAGDQAASIARGGFICVSPQNGWKRSSPKKMRVCAFVRRFCALPPVFCSNCVFGRSPVVRSSDLAAAARNLQLQSAAMILC